MHGDSQAITLVHATNFLQLFVSRLTEDRNEAQQLTFASPFSYNDDETLQARIGQECPLMLDSLAWDGCYTS
jgi:hypothetical protein